MRHEQKKKKNYFIYIYIEGIIVWVYLHRFQTSIAIYTVQRSLHQIKELRRVYTNCGTPRQCYTYYIIAVSRVSDFFFLTFLLEHDFARHTRMCITHCINICIIHLPIRRAHISVLVIKNCTVRRVWFVNYYPSLTILSIYFLKFNNIIYNVCAHVIIYLIYIIVLQCTYAILRHNTFRDRYHNCYLNCIFSCIVLCSTV